MKFNIPIAGFIETSFVDWEDKVTAVLFLSCCNFRCPYCQNADLVLTPETFVPIDIDDILDKLNKYEGWIDGICITGGEPTIHKELPRMIRYIRENSKFLIKLDTNGSNPEMLENLIIEKLIDAVSMDVKAPLDDLRYRKAAGAVVNLDDIKKSIDILNGSGLFVEFRTTIHPSLFKREDIEDLAGQLKGVKRFKLQNFSKRAETIAPEFKGSEPFPDGEFEELQKIAEDIIRG